MRMSASFFKRYYRSVDYHYSLALIPEQGICRYGKGCNKAHTPLSQTSIPPAPRREPVSHLLPSSTVQIEGISLIPINEYGERIDTLLSKPTPGEWGVYQQRAKINKPCNRFNLLGQCEKVDCAFDHAPPGPEALRVMGYLGKGYPCPKGGKCRLANCYQGHICQKDDCLGGMPCKLNRTMHNVEPRVAEWLPPTELTKGDNQSTSDDSQEECYMQTYPNGYP